MNKSVAVFFGKNGRIGQICAEAIGEAIDSYNIGRSTVLFQCSQKNNQELDYGRMLSSIRNKKTYIFDCSIDHSSSEAILVHEIDKQRKILEIINFSAEAFYVGFSSGIMGIPEERIKLPHMKTYKSAKSKQEKFARSLNIPCFVPRIYTLIGKNTYQRRAAAWASIFAARISNEAGYVITDPDQKREWVSEIYLKEAIKRFIDEPSAEQVGISMSEGVFTHGDIAQCTTDNRIPSLDYAIGVSNSWLTGDYVSDHPPKHDPALLMKRIKQFIPEV